MEKKAVCDPSLAHRTGWIVVKTKPGETVTVEQMEHAFWFGTAIAEPIMRGLGGAENREKYLSILKENFNSAVHENSMKWAYCEKQQGAVSYEIPDWSLAWCKENGIRMRGHCVFWEVEEFVQDWVKGLDDESLRSALKRRAFDLMAHYKGKIPEFDVNNEMVHGNFYSSRLGESIWKDMFDWCKEANPDAVLYVNDFGILSGDDLPKYEKQIETLLARGVPLGGIGLQGHFRDQVDGEKVKRVLDALARFNLPIKVTEFDMKTLDEDAKAKGLETLYRTCFEHPAVNGVLMWGFWAGSHWLSSKRWGIEGHTALWDRDWKPMPAAVTYRDLVFREWWTREKGVANDQGICEIPVFLGKHRVSVSGVEHEVDVLDAGSRVRLETD